MQMYLLSTRQILHSGLRLEGDKSSFTFCDKSGYTVLSATFNLWSNVQIMRTCIPKYNVPNPVSLTIRYLDFETLHHNFGHVSDKVMHYFLDNIEDVKKIYLL